MYEASVLDVLGARMSVIRRSLQLEYALLGVLTSAFAVLTGTLLAGMLLHYRLGLGRTGMHWVGVATAVAVSTSSLGLGAMYLRRQLRISPAQLLCLRA